MNKFGKHLISAASGVSASHEEQQSDVTTDEELEHVPVQHESAVVCDEVVNEQPSMGLGDALTHRPTTPMQQSNTEQHTPVPVAAEVHTDTESVGAAPNQSVLDQSVSVSLYPVLPTLTENESVVDNESVTSALASQSMSSTSVSTTSSKLGGRKTRLQVGRRSNMRAIGVRVSNQSVSSTMRVSNRSVSNTNTQTALAAHNSAACNTQSSSATATRETADHDVCASPSMEDVTEMGCTSAVLVTQQTDQSHTETAVDHKLLVQGLQQLQQEEDMDMSIGARIRRRAQSVEPNQISVSVSQSSVSKEQQRAASVQPTPSTSAHKQPPCSPSASVSSTNSQGPRRSARIQSRESTPRLASSQSNERTQQSAVSDKHVTVRRSTRRAASTEPFTPNTAIVPALRDAIKQRATSTEPGLGTARVTGASGRPRGRPRKLSTQSNADESMEPGVLDTSVRRSARIRSRETTPVQPSPDKHDETTRALSPLKEDTAESVEPAFVAPGPAAKSRVRRTLKAGRASMRRSTQAQPSANSHSSPVQAAAQKALRKARKSSPRSSPTVTRRGMASSTAEADESSDQTGQLQSRASGSGIVSPTVVQAIKTAFDNAPKPVRQRPPSTADTEEDTLLLQQDLRKRSRQTTLRAGKRGKSSASSSKDKDTDKRPTK